MKDRRKSKMIERPPDAHTDILGDAVAELYSAFSKRRLSPGGPDACTQCCASPESMARIAQCPKQAITFEDLSEYHSAAKGENAGQDLAYLLPRTMEFLAEGRAPECAGAFALFAHYFPPVWPELEEREREAIRRYSAALLRWRFSLEDESACNYDILDILEVCASGGFDIEPVVDMLADPLPTATATSCLIDLILYRADFWQDGMGFYDVSAERAVELSTAIRRALSSPNVLALLEKAALSEGCGEFAGKASWAYDFAESMGDDLSDPVT